MQQVNQNYSYCMWIVWNIKLDIIIIIITLIDDVWYPYDHEWWNENKADNIFCKYSIMFEIYIWTYLNQDITTGISILLLSFIQIFVGFIRQLNANYFFHRLNFYSFIQLLADVWHIHSTTLLSAVDHCNFIQVFFVVVSILEK